MSLSPRKIAVAHPYLCGREREYVLECIDTTWISSVGTFISRFETQFAEYAGARNAIAVSNGTVALHAALLGLGVEAGDEVIVPTMTFVATANTVAYCNATPVLVDSEPRTFNVDPARVEAAVTNKTRGIIPVHLYGHPCDMDAIRDIARRHDLWVLEDAAEALGATYRGARAGSLGDCATFSFFGNKTITTGEGGMIVTDDDALAARIRLIKGQGMDPKHRYWFPQIGYNYRMTNVAAAIGLGQLEQIDTHLGRRDEVRAWYDELLAPLEGRVRRPIEEPWAHSSYWMYSVALEDGVPRERDDVMRAMSERGVETRPVFYPMHVMPVFSADSAHFPVATWYGERGISLPTHALLSREDVEYVVEVLAESITA
jgi:perosamine synthetase